MKKQRIALMLHQLRYGGAERGLVYLARGFLERGLDVDFLVRSKKYTAYMEDLPQGVRLLETGKGRPLQTRWLVTRHFPLAARHFWKRDALPMTLRMLPGLVSYLKSERPDGLLTTMPQNNITAIWGRRVAKVPTRIVIREANAFSKALETQDDESPRSMHRLAARWYPEADGIVSVCNGVGDDLASHLGLPRARIQTIYNPVDLERIERLAAEPAPHPWLADKTQPVLVSVGRLHLQKDHGTLLKVLAQLNRQSLVRLLLIGEGELKEALQNLAASLGVQDQVDMIGNTPNPYGYISRADVFVLSSAWEGFPNVLLEALACRTPIVSTDCIGGGPAELLENGKYGQLVPVGDTAGMAEAIEEALHTPVDLEAGYHYVESFTMERSVDNYLSLLLEERAGVL